MGHSLAFSSEEGKRQKLDQRYVLSDNMLSSNSAPADSTPSGTNLLIVNMLSAHQFSFLLDFVDLCLCHLQPLTSLLDMAFRPHQSRLSHWPLLPNLGYILLIAVELPLATCLPLVYVNFLDLCSTGAHSLASSLSLIKPRAGTVRPRIVPRIVALALYNMCV